jgi:hypothetical protein
MSAHSNNSTADFSKIQPTFQEYVDFCATINILGTPSDDNVASSISAAASSIASDAAQIVLTTRTLTEYMTSM